MESILTLRDGRELEYLDNQVAGDHAIVLHHGSPCEMHVWHRYISQLTALGVRAIAFTRPGYGNSTPMPDRNLQDGNADLAELLGFLKISEFVSVGWSAGGPPALASGLLSGCKGISAVASPAPHDADDLDYYLGMGESFAEECRATALGVESAFEYKQRATAGLGELTVDELLNAFAPRSAMPEFSERYKAMGLDLRKTFNRALTPDAMGYTVDDISFMKPWGFRVESIDAPVSIWLGTNDVFIPKGHATWLHEHTKNSTLRLLQDQDHISIWVEQTDDILSEAVSWLD